MQTNKPDLEDRLATAAAKRSGLSKLHAASPLVQFSGPKRSLINSCLTSMHDERFINAVSQRMISAICCGQVISNGLNQVILKQDISTK